jgi:hypothetical protein
VKVRHDEGVANRIGPEPCASNGEASVGECTGQPLSRESFFPGRRRRSVGGRQYVGARHRKCPYGPAWSKNLAYADAPCLWEPGELAFRPLGLRPPVRVRKARSRS